MELAGAESNVSVALARLRLADRLGESDADHALGQAVFVRCVRWVDVSAVKCVSDERLGTYLSNMPRRRVPPKSFMTARTLRHHI